MAKQHGVDLSLVRAVDANEERKAAMATRVQTLCGGDIAGKTIGVWGITFKANTDDVRESPRSPFSPSSKPWAPDQLFDPEATRDVEDMFDTLTLCDSPYDAAASADALVAFTEWDVPPNRPCAHKSANDHPATH